MSCEEHRIKGQKALVQIQNRAFIIPVTSGKAFNLYSAFTSSQSCGEENECKKKSERGKSKWCTYVQASTLVRADSPQTEQMQKVQHCPATKTWTHWLWTGSWSKE